MTRSTQTTPAVSANCDSSSSDSSTGQSVPGMSTPTRIARSGARESKVLDCFSSPAMRLNCSAIDSSNSLLCFGLVFLFCNYLDTQCMSPAATREKELGTPQTPAGGLRPPAPPAHTCQQ